jgi:hypothetical protein
MGGPVELVTVTVTRSQHRAMGAAARADRAAKGPSAPPAAVRPMIGAGSSRRSLFCCNAAELASPKLVCLSIRGGRVAGKPEAQERQTEHSRPGSRAVPRGWRHLTVGGPEVAMDVEIEQPPQGGKVGGRVAGGHVSPIQYCAQAPLIDQHVARMQVTMDPDSLPAVRRRRDVLLGKSEPRPRLSVAAQPTWSPTPDAKQGEHHERD